MSKTDDPYVEENPAAETDITEAPSEVINPEKRQVSFGVKQLLRDAADWRELRKTPFGLTPILAFSVLGVAGSFLGAVFSAASPEIRRDLEINVRSLINVSVSLGVVTILAAIPIAHRADRTRRVPYIWIGGVVGALGFLAMSRSSSIVLVGIWLSIAAIGFTIYSIPQSSILADYYPPEVRGKAFAALGVAPRLARVAVPAIVGVMVTTWSWRAPYLAFAPLMMIAAVYAGRKLREPKRGYFERKALGATEEVALQEEEPVSLGEAWRTVWSVRTVRRFFLATALNAGFSAAFNFWYIFFLADHYSLDAGERGLMFSFVAIFYLIGGFLGGGLVDFFTRRRPSSLLILSGLVDLAGVFALLALALAPPLPVAVGLYCVFALANSLTGPAVGAIFSQIFPSHVRTVGFTLQGLAELPGTIIIFPLVASIVENRGGNMQAGMLFCIPFLVISALMALSASGFFEGDMRNAFASALAGAEWRRTRERGKGKLLICRDVDVEYDGVQVLFGVNFEIEEGEIIALLGTNGAGKSTLLRAISGTQEAANGAIVFDGRDITHMPPHEIAQRQVIHMPGGRGVFPGLSVRENLLLGLWMVDDRTEAANRLDEVLEIFPVLAERLDANAVDLSGGEQQQLSLAQAFMGNPRLLLIDELSLGLAPAVVGQLLEIVKELHRRGTTIVVVEQSVNVALTLADKAVFMEKGEVRFQGPTKELLRRPDILRAVYVKGSAAIGTGGSVRAGGERRRSYENVRNVLEVEGLEKRYGGVVALDGVSFSIREGEAIGLIGPNGSGKTTTFDLISGYQTPDAGIVRLEGVDITKLGPEERAKRHLVRRFQDARLFPSLTVFETILIALEEQLEVKSTLLNAVALPNARKAERRLRVRAERLIELLEIGSYRDKFVKELSTGLRRIVDLACVLAAEPRVLLLDEPSSGIAQAEAEGLAPLFQQIRFETGCSLLIIEHDMPLISAVADELIAMERGKVIARGRPDAVLDDERVIESYLGGSESTINRSGLLPGVAK